MLDQITPIILTLNESPNIGRTLERLTWARDIVVVDSGSTDATRAIAIGFPQVRFFVRPFDSHSAQWRYALTETRISTEWVLALDADYLVTPTLLDELRALRPAATVDGFELSFRYCVRGRPLRGSLYPPVVALFRHQSAQYVQDGHTQRILVNGSVQKLLEPAWHDDRKPFTRWLRSQRNYARLEALKLRESAWAQLGWPDRVRRIPFLAVVPAAAYCLFIRGCVLDGINGVIYAGQRAIAEAVMSIELLKAQSRVDRLDDRRSSDEA